MIADRQELVAKVGEKGLDKAEATMAKKDPKEFARRDHFTLLNFSLLLFVPVGIAFQNILLRKMSKMSSNTVSVYVNPFMAICCFAALKMLQMDTYEYIVDMFTRDWPSLLLFLF